MKLTLPLSLPCLSLIILVAASADLIAREAAAPAETSAGKTLAGAPSANWSQQLEAAGKYPELTRADSPFNQEFLSRARHLLATNRAFFENERWPLELADEVAAAGFPTALAVVIPDAPAPANQILQPPSMDGSLIGRSVSVPSHAPDVVHAAVEAGNLLQSKPYKWGGGHGQLEDSGYDCSGSVSYVLRKTGMLGRALTSRGFVSYGDPGPGRWITIYAAPGHVFMTVCGIRLDTGGRGGMGGSGPRWSPVSRYTQGYVARHPVGF